LVSIRKLPGRLLSLLGRAKRVLSGEETKIIKAQFDSDFYAAAYQLSDKSKHQLVKHYVRKGWRLGFNPSPAFSPQKYLAQYPDVKETGIEPFYHYLKFGAKEGRQAVPPEIIFQTKSGKVGSVLDLSGKIESAFYSHETRLLVAAGWCLRPIGADVGLNTEATSVKLDDGFSQKRPDVADPDGAQEAKAGFISLIRANDQCNKVFFHITDHLGIRHRLSESTPIVISANPKKASEILFSIPTALTDFAKRVRVVDEPFLSPLIQKHRSDMLLTSAEFKTVGQPPAAALVDIVIPLYGTLQHVDNQLLHFSQDNWLKDHVSIFYVLDDPRLADQFRSRLEQLYRLYRVSFTCVDGGINRGFSSANNLGASAGSSEYILFMNSDVIPQDPGWLARLIQPLRDNPGTGAVAPRLTFGDDTIQFAGMELRWHEDLQIWINHHVLKGFSVNLDPPQVRDVQCLTGACLLLRRADFEYVGGWDTGYLIGDFEDSDLCFKLRQQGLRMLYVPHVQLTHLERQSMNQIGSNDYRMRVTIFNAVRHQMRWGLPTEDRWNVLQPGNCKESLLTTS
jgi:O-antigen biosynthesis protein